LETAEEETASPGVEELEEMESPEVSRQRREERVSPEMTEVDPTWWCVVQVPNVKLPTRLGATTNIGYARED
jgi:hypothetical protein